MENVDYSHTSLRKQCDSRHRQISLLLIFIHIPRNH